VTVTDAAGNSATASSPAFKYDQIAPTPRGLIAPAPNARLAAEPTYSWTRFDDGTSGTSRYEVLYRVGSSNGSYSLLARAGHPTDPRVTTVSTARNALATPLPVGQDVWWRVRTYDNAGNASLTSARRLRIDPTAPPAPQFTGGPGGPTNDARPTFSWNGNQPTYEWDVTAAGEESPAQSGRGAGSAVTLGTLPDGDYTFRVLQVSALGVPSADATRSFTVDTVAPAAPVITRRPGFPATGSAVFEWSMEPGAFGRWTVIGAGGAVVRGPSDAPAPSVTLDGLAGGSYSFRLSAIDPAGNASALLSEPFTISGASGRSASQTARLPRQNALRLRPRVGATVMTRRPTLKWVKGPRGTTVYNVQVFRVGRVGRNGQPQVRKILTAFPRKQRYTLKKRLATGTCYVWRVWPYQGNRFAPKPLGISNFCVAKASAIRRAKARS
jgi:hypothetical protein